MNIIIYRARTLKLWERIVHRWKDVRTYNNCSDIIKENPVVMCATWLVTRVSDKWGHLLQGHLKVLYFSLLGEVNPKDSAIDCYCLLPVNNPQATASMGTYTVRWKRAADMYTQVLTSTVAFPPTSARYQPYTVSAGIS